MHGYNEGWPTKNAGDAPAGVLGSIFLGRLFVSFLVSKMKIGYRACPTTGGLISLIDEFLNADKPKRQTTYRCLERLIINLQTPP